MATQMPASNSRKLLFNPAVVACFVCPGKLYALAENTTLYLPLSDTPDSWDPKLEGVSVRGQPEKQDQQGNCIRRLSATPGPVTSVVEGTAEASAQEAFPPGASVCAQGLSTAQVSPPDCPDTCLTKGQLTMGLIVPLNLPGSTSVP